MEERKPTMSSTIGMLRNFGIEVSEIIDVGVLNGTDYLMSNFNDAFHHLFEPVDIFAAEIERRYKDIPHHLYQVALSSAAGEAFQVGLSRDATGKVTNSQLCDRLYLLGEIFNGAPVVECKPVRMTTLDEHFAQHGAPSGRYLVKIDVDGHEMPIIEGGRNVIRGADLVIVEATTTTLLDRANAVAAMGFELIDIVDMCYYHRTLAQVDLVMANRELLRRCPDLDPWNSKSFSKDAWFNLSVRLDRT